MKWSKRSLSASFGAVELYEIPLCGGTEALKNLKKVA